MKKIISTILVFVSIFFIFKALALLIRPSDNIQEKENTQQITTQLGSIDIFSIVFIEVVSREFGHYVIIHFKKNGHEALQTMDKEEYMKIRDIILANGVTEIVT